jgi:hypothetical protein
VTKEYFSNYTGGIGMNCRFLDYPKQFINNIEQLFEDFEKSIITLIEDLEKLTKCYSIMS